MIKTRKPLKFLEELVLVCFISFGIFVCLALFLRLVIFLFECDLGLPLGLALRAVSEDILIQGDTARTLS